MVQSNMQIEEMLAALDLEEKVKLLAGDSIWTTHAVDRLAIPAITVSDGPHGVRGTSFFNGPAGCLLPSATAMGATFDVLLMRRVGEMLADEAKDKGCQLLLGPTVCIQRSPLLGRGFEAFAEDPWLSGMMASGYINGLQNNGVAACLKHYAAHDQSDASTEDDVRASQRTLREMHLMPFQIAVKHSNPWSIMTAYNKINGVHCAEDPWLLDHVLRSEWKWDGVVLSDWYGTYSTSEAVNAGMDLEMPGPSRWRAGLLSWAMTARKVLESTVDRRVRAILTLLNRVQLAQPSKDRPVTGDTEEKRDLCRRVAAESIVLLKNSRGILPLRPEASQTYGLIGPAMHNPAIVGGGSAELLPYYVSSPYEAIQKVVGEKNVQEAVGCYTHRFTPLMNANCSIPGTTKPGFSLEWFDKDPCGENGIQPCYTTTTTHAQMHFADNLPSQVPGSYFLRVQTEYKAPEDCVMQIGLCVLGKGRLLVHGKEVIDLYTSHPDKTHPTPIFNAASMERVANIKMTAGKIYPITVFLENQSVVPGLGVLDAGGLRIGCCPEIDPAAALTEAVELARRVDVPIVIAGLSSDYECEGGDRPDLALPAAIDELIARVAGANPRTVVLTQSGTPILMPWIEQVSSVLHCWYGGQETGNAMADVLFGKVNPCGRLSMTFPRRLEETPAFLTFSKCDREIYYGEGVFVGYRYAEMLKLEPLFYFGHGLSYSRFVYSNLCVPTSLALNESDNFEVKIDIQNDGPYDGFEVVQVYVSEKTSAVLRPFKELKGFAKVWIKAGENATAVIKLDKYAVSYWDMRANAWVAKQGLFSIIVSRSAHPDDAVASKEFQLNNTLTWSGL